MPLHFQFTWTMLLTAIIIVAVAFLLCRRGYQRNPKRLTYWLEALRFSIIVLICLLLFQPEWIITSEPKQEPEINILWDDSGSMETKDIVYAANKVATRKEYIAQLLENGLGKEFEGGNLVRIAPFGTPPDDDSAVYQSATTDLAAPLDDALKQSDNVRAIIMLTDGSHNAPSSPLASAQQMRNRNIPFYAVPIGSPNPLPDLALVDVQAPTYGIVGEMVQIPFTIKSSLDRDVNVPLTLRSKTDQSEKTVQVRIPAHSEVSDSIVWKIPQKELNMLELVLPVQQGEMLDDNNSTEFAITGREEAINVLVIDSFPRWEYRFIRNALYRDPGVQVNTLLIHPDLDMPGEGPGYLTKFPENLDDLSRYDVVFIGDIGLGKKGISSHQATLLKGLVANQASGLVFLPGYQGNQLSLLESDLGDLFPVTVDKNMPGGTTSSEVMGLSLTADGRGSLLTLLADSEDENDLVWRNLPGFNWYAPVVRAKAGTQILAVHATRKNSYGRIPLIVTQPYGNGKILYMGIDSAWRWRKDVEDKYHYRFWGQVARWMSYRRNMAAGEKIRLMLTPERPHPGDTVNLTAIVSDEHGSPLEKGDVYIDIIDPDGNTNRQQLQPQESGWGAFGTSFKLPRSGNWMLKCISSETPGTPVEMHVAVTREAIEKKGLPVNTELLTEMATITKGRVISADMLGNLADEIRKLPVPPPQEKRILIWSHPVTMIVMMVLLGIFWIGRKLNGTI